MIRTSCRAFCLEQATESLTVYGIRFLGLARMVGTAVVQMAEPEMPLGVSESDLM